MKKIIDEAAQKYAAELSGMDINVVRKAEYDFKQGAVWALKEVFEKSLWEDVEFKL